MTPRVGPRSVARSLVVAAAIVLVPACDGGAPSKPRSQPVQDLEIPTSAEAEAAEKLRDAQVFVDAKKPRLAEPLLRRVLELKPDDPRAAGMLARCLADRGDLEEAVTLLRRALVAAPRATEFHALLVKSLEQLGDTAGAEQAALAWTQADPADAEAFYKLGIAIYRAGRFKDAIKEFARAESLKPQRADIRSEHGLALAAAGHLVKAEAKQRDAIDRQPSYAEAWFRLGDVIFRINPARAREAAEAMEQAVDREPGNANAQLSLFRIARLAKVADDDALRVRGERAWQAVLRLHGRAQTAAAAGAAAQFDEKTSEFALREAVSLRPEDVAARLALARFLHADRRWDEAIDAYRLAIALNASAPEPRLQLAAAVAAQAAGLTARGAAASGTSAADAAERLRAAETEARAALAAAAAPLDTSASVAANRLLAWVLLLQGRDQDAAAAADAAILTAPGDVLARKLRALARMHLGEVDEGLNEVAALGWL